MFKMKTDMADIKKYNERISAIIEECVIDELVAWAKEDDEYLRGNEGFKDHTGNLRSSLGAAVFRDGRMLYSTPFSTVLTGTKGSAEGRRAAEALASRTIGRIAKVMVAGMDYAQRVEDIDSKDVLESRRIQCEREAKGVYERAMRRAEQEIGRL